jgi:hypothetical protein
MYFSTRYSLGVDFDGFLDVENVGGLSSGKEGNKFACTQAFKLGIRKNNDHPRDPANAGPGG